MRSRLLIVDDHNAFRSAARFIFEAEGFDVVGEASSTAQAREAVDRLRPDVVLLDVQLPDGDGIRLCGELTRCSGSNPAVILTSSRDFGDYGVELAQTGARAFVPKSELSGTGLAALLEDC